MTQPRPTTQQIADAIDAAEVAVAAAATCRQRYARRRAPTRDAALEAAASRCAAAAQPLRSWIGMVAWEGIALEDELAMKKAVAALRYERRQIGKML